MATQNSSGDAMAANYPLAFFVLMMARITLPYIPYNTDVGFLRIKQDYIDIDVWRTAFFVHVYMSIWVLLAGFTQFSKRLRSGYPALHRGLFRFSEGSV